MPIASPFAPRKKPVTSTPLSPGLVSAVNPQNQGLANAISGMQGINQGIANRGPLPPYQPTPGPSGLQTTGGAFGNPGATPLPFERGPTPQAAPLGLAPNSQSAFDQQMAAQNSQGRLFGGALPTMTTSPGGQLRPGFMSEPARDMSQRPQFPMNDYATTPGGALTPISGNTQLATAAAKKMLNSPERKAYLSGRQADLDSRNERRFAREMAQGDARTERLQNRKETQELARGNMSFEQRLDAANPAAAQAYRVAASQARDKADEFVLDLAERGKDRISRETIAGNRDATALKAKGMELGLTPDGKAAADAEPPLPADLKGKPLAVQKELVKNLPQAIQDQLLEEANRTSRLGRIFGDINQPGQAPISGVLDDNAVPFTGGYIGGSQDLFTRGLASGINTPQLNNPRWGALKPGDLKDQPGDTPAQRRLKSELRARKLSRST